MRISEHWLREWVNPSLTAQQIAEQLTMAGLEVESVAPVAEKFSRVVIGQILKIEKHPQAERLNVCLVDTGGGERLTIVCGADNIREGMIVPVAIDNAELPGDFKIKQTQIRGITSYGMLCSLRELGISEDGQGIYELPKDAPLGHDLWDYLKLSDNIFDISITPNRGDCLSVMGLAKELSAITQTKLNVLTESKLKKSTSGRVPFLKSIDVQVPNECPHYTGRIIRGIKADAITPIWMQERLRRSDIRCISPVVDVMNYVMIELGQPMHAFDLSQIDGDLCVRKAKQSEELLLLDGSTAKLKPETMVIADSKKPLAIAGVMGGHDSGVTLLTQNVFLESAYFNPESIAKTVRSYGLNSDSSYRFERGIDPAIQIQALDRATQLLLEIVGGDPGPIIETTHDLPKNAVITLRKEKANKLLGVELDGSEVESMLKRLGFHCKKSMGGWIVNVPARRPDITIEEDLIEEIARLYGYQNIPEHFASVLLKPTLESERKITVKTLRHALSDLGYQEVVTYSFIDPKHQSLFEPELKPRELINPITSEMAVMRTSLWPGLVNTLLYNQNRQQLRARLFETGLRFLTQDGILKQEPVVSGLINGALYPEQWGVKSREVDFFDLKGDLQNLFKLTSLPREFTFRPSTHPSLHSGQSAAIYRGEQMVGRIGALHPSLVRELGITGKTYVFELVLLPILLADIPMAREVSKFPEIRRDIAILVDKAIPSKAIQDTIITVGGEFLRDVNIFDVYEGHGITPDRKSVALALTLQHPSRTLIDEDVVSIMERVISALKNKFAAELRG